MGMSIYSKLSRAALGVALAIGTVAVAASSAEAYAKNPTPDITKVSTSKAVKLTDPIDNTFFKKDPGGTAVKIELRRGSTYLGKVEFHPYGEVLYIYDTRNDSDTFYVEVRSPNWGFQVYDGRDATASGFGLRTENVSIDENKPVYITVYDNSGQRDRITLTTGFA